MVTDGHLARKGLHSCGYDPNGKYLLVMSAINPGNSGGPMILRETGEVLAMVDAVLLDDTFGNTYISCGIPSATIQEFLDKNLPPRKE